QTSRHSQNTHTHTHTDTHTHTHTQTHIYIDRYIQNTQIQYITCTHKYSHTNIHTHAKKYICTHIHTSTYAQDVNRCTHSKTKCQVRLSVRVDVESQREPVERAELNLSPCVCAPVSGRHAS